VVEAIEIQTQAWQQGGQGLGIEIMHGQLLCFCSQKRDTQRPSGLCSRDAVIALWRMHMRTLQRGRMFCNSGRSCSWRFRSFQTRTKSNVSVFVLVVRLNENDFRNAAELGSSGSLNRLGMSAGAEQNNSNR
jgi:hypothetical protein